MNIAFIARRYDRVGGTEIDLYHLTELLASFGHDITVYCQQVRTSPAPGITIKKVPAPPLGRLMQMLGLAWIGPKMAYHGGHDMVIGFTRVLKQDLVRCGGGTHKLFVEKMKSAEGGFKRLLRSISPYHNALIAVEKKQFQRGCKKVLAISEVVKHEIMSVYSVPEDRIEVIYDGIDTKLFSPEKREKYRYEIREKFSIPQDAFVILFLGSGYKRKNLTTLLEALPQVNHKNTYCLVVGGDKRPQSYAAKARSLGIEDKTVFAGVQKEAEKFYGAADIFVIPSLQEAFGNVVLEAMASGLPAVTTSLSGASEVMEGEMKSLVLNDPHNVQGLAKIISKLTDKTLRERLSGEAREISKAYTLEANARAIEKLCNKIIKEKRHG
ncbi:MAG: glycosyltransferase family 4 protein [Deltaproteobacteria bacterium]|nr:glycosyltransferase family 4 protein [Deltaproteobacteria bacterium]